MKKLGVLVSALAVTAVAAQVNAAESASALITLQSHVASTYTYSVTLTDTGTTDIGTFWFAWVPGQDYLDSVPSAVSNPTSWTDNLTGSGNASDGTAIQWLAGSGAALTPGNSLSTFGFSTTDSPTMIAGDSASHPGTLVGTSFVYSGAPFSDSGFEFVATVAPVPEPTTLCVAGLATMFVGLRRPRRA